MFRVQENRGVFAIVMRHQSSSLLRKRYWCYDMARDSDGGGGGPTATIVNAV